MKLSLIVPAYNERATLGPLLALASRALRHVETEIVIVDDGSRDGTREWLQQTVPQSGLRAPGFLLNAAGALLPDPAAPGPGMALIAIYHPGNRGKGAAIRTGFQHVTGDVIAIQDADLEYDPHDLAAMFSLFADRGVADVVYGSRFYGNPHRSLYYHHYLANRVISTLFNILFNQTLTDIECCYKMMSAAVARSLALSANDFGIEIEISAGIARQRRLRVYEIGISYFGRTYAEGKKINWRDGVLAFWYLVKFRARTPRIPARFV